MINVCMYVCVYVSMNNNDYDYDNNNNKHFKQNCSWDFLILIHNRFVA